ncbi:hypothetical protein BD410DRAFT_804034 [Rickenella mellea]|uniref:Uncharacterized protein n=1 Tax=Rickenella mellea TaxID=50990 RepID=A0A4Y7Q2U9_9AGAM|nr:hypothetical protein BD410DRAFT_804034 [Rickenella mellea]
MHDHAASPSHIPPQSTSSLSVTSSSDSYATQTERRFDSMLAKVRPFIPAPIRRRIFKHINTLPVELLAEIFLWCHPIGIFPRPSRDRAPILLERVCRVWRLVSLNTPQLWTHILIEDMKWSWDPPTTWNSRLFDEWLRRSGNCPLSFTIKDHNIEYHAPFTLKLQAEAHRWKSDSRKCTDVD